MFEHFELIASTYLLLQIFAIALVQLLKNCLQKVSHVDFPTSAKENSNRKKHPRKKYRITKGRAKLEKAPQSAIPNRQNGDSKGARFQRITWSVFVDSRPTFVNR